MKSRREFLMTLTAGLGATAVIFRPLLAEEPFGVITEVDRDGKEVTLITKQGETVKVKITDSTEVVTGYGEKLTLAELAEALSKAIKDGRKGVFARVTHENKVASKITVGMARKKVEK